MRFIFILFISPLIILTSLTGKINYEEKFGDESRIALVIGNNNYKNHSKLINPINDAKDIGNKLIGKNFEVIYVPDGTKRKIDEALRAFNKKLENGGVGLFYYSGHGIEIEKENFLIPIDANLKSELDVKYDSISVDKVIEGMKRSKTRLNIVILDACRNNPFSRGSGGLAPMANAEGTIISYATASGSVASDNPMETNGLYTKHLLKALDEPLNQRELFHQVRKNVYEESNKTQRAYLNDGTIGDFFFTLPNSNKKDNLIIKNAFFENKFLNSYDEDLYYLTLDIQNISTKDIAITSSDLEITYSDYVEMNNNTWASFIFSNNTVKNDPIYIKPSEIKRLVLQKPIHIKGLISNLTLNAKLNDYHCIKSGNSYKLPFLYQTINFNNNSIFTIYIFTHNKFLEFSTELKFGSDYISSPDKIINHEKTVGHYIYIFNRDNNTGYQKQIKERHFVYRNCLPKDYSERKKWKKMK